MFDPYHKWLGIPPKDQPPNYYRLLAIDPFESDPEVIDAAANRQMAYVQQRATGEHTAESQKLLNELAAARLCLLDQKKKAQYDLQLRINLRQQARQSGETRSKPPKIDPPFSLKSRGPLMEQEPAPPIAGKAKPPLAQDQPAEESFFSRIPRRTRMIIIALGGGIILVAALIIAMHVMPGREKEGDAVADRTKSEDRNTPAKGADAENNSQIRMSPKTSAAAVYNVEIDPPQATLSVQNNMGTITGSGRSRQIRFDNIPWHSYVVITASCEGYKTYTQPFAPRAGQSEHLSIELQKDTPTVPSTVQSTSSSTVPPKSSSTSSTSSTPNVADNLPAPGTNNPPIKINRPIDVRGESVPSAVETTKTERRKVFVFTGGSAIVTPVKRSLPSTVEAWLWCSAPAENAEMYVFGSDDAKQPNVSGLGMSIGKDGQLGGRRTQKNKKQWNFLTDEKLAIKKWTHLAATFDENKICLFVDGRLVHTDDKGAQETGSGKFVVGYIGIVYNIRQYNPIYAFVGRIRTVRISSGIRYNGDFRPPPDFNKNQDKEGFKTILIYDAADGKTDSIPDISGNKKDGQGLNIQIVEEDIPEPNHSR
ncbi:MAG: LamG-like jellyroll fold domain-containing protein [Thermoguttaceae bacterium]|jgi:hypothetical protein